MQAPLQIAFHHLDGSDAVKDLIEEKVAWLERFYTRITGCRVVVERQGQPERYEVRINLAVPGGDIAVSRDSVSHADDLAAVVRGAFDVARRQLEQHARRQRHE